MSAALKQCFVWVSSEDPRRHTIEYFRHVHRMYALSMKVTEPYCSVVYILPLRPEFSAMHYTSTCYVFCSRAIFMLSSDCLPNAF